MSQLLRALLVAALVVLLSASPNAAFAGEAKDAADESDNTLVLGLTATQLAIAAVVGAGVGVAAGLASGDVIAAGSLGFGALAAIYVAHLAVEAALVGGVYYWWPAETKPEDPASRTMAIKGANTVRGVIPALQLSR